MNQNNDDGFHESESTFVFEPVDGLIDGYPRQTFAAMMEDAKASPLSDRSVDDIFTEIFETQFGRKPQLDAGSAHSKSNTRL